MAKRREQGTGNREQRSDAATRAAGADGSHRRDGDAPVTAFAPLPYQRRWIADAARFKIGLMARQVGKSTAVALEVNDDILRAESSGARTLWVLLSRGERQSHELARKVRDFGRMIAEGRKALGQAPELVELGGNATEIRYPGGSRVVALPANPDTARGYSGHVVLDEFAFHQDSDAIWTALFPTITRGYKVRVISTPNGLLNRYAQLWRDATSGGPAASGWSAHKVTIHEAVEQGLDVNADQLRAGIRDELAWRQEFLCEFVDEATAWLTWDLIRASEKSWAELPAVRIVNTKTDRTNLGGVFQIVNVDGPGLIYVGWDVARWHDLSVCWALERVGDVLVTRAVIEMRGIEFEQQLETVTQLCTQARRFGRLCIDATGLGEMPAEQAARKLGSRVEAIKFSGGIKELLAGDLRRVLEDRTLRLPAEPAIRDDLHSVRRTTTAAGNVRFAGETDGSHADRFWALALAVHGAVAQRSSGIWFAA